MPALNLKAPLEAVRRKISKRMPENGQYAKVSAHLSAAIRTLEEIDTQPQNTPPVDKLLNANLEGI
jgi:hypothetical protein